MGAHPKEEAPVERLARVAQELDDVWDKPRACRCCPTKTRHGIAVEGFVVPACHKHHAAWEKSGEKARALAAVGKSRGMRRALVALADFINRQQAESREHGGRA